MDTSKYTFIDLGLPSGLLWSMTAIDHTDHPDAIAKYGKDMPTWETGRHVFFLKALHPHRRR